MKFLLLIFPCHSYSSDELYKPGEHYQLLEKPVPTVTGEKIEVTEVFLYQCKHCFRFEPRLRHWQSKLADDIKIVKLPLISQKQDEFYARIFFAGQQLGIESDVTANTFKAFHVKNNFHIDEALASKIFLKLGIKKEEFKKIIESKAINAKVKEAKERAKKFVVMGTPQLVINGQYTITPKKGISQYRMLEIADFLINKIRSKNMSSSGQNL